MWTVAETCPRWCSGGHTCTLSSTHPHGTRLTHWENFTTNTLGLQIQKIDSVPKWGLQKTEQRGILRNGPRDAPPSRNWGKKGSSMNIHWKGISAGGRTSGVCIFLKVKFRKSLRKGSLEADNCWADTDAGSDKRKINCPLAAWRSDVQKSFTLSAADVCFNGDDCVTGKHQEKMKSEGMETEIDNSWRFGQN